MEPRIVRIAATAFPGIWSRGNQHLYPEGFVLLFDADMNPISWANEFMHSKCRSLSRARKDWRKSQRAYADDLGVLQIFLVVREISFSDLRDDDLVSLATVLLQSVSPTTRKRYDVKTVRRRVNTFVKCCEWHQGRGGLGRQVITYVQQTSRKIVGRAIARVQAVSTLIDTLPAPSADDTKVSPIPNTHLIRILNRLGPEFKKELNPDRRDRLIAEIALETGMREDEIAWLTVSQILGLVLEPDDTAFLSLSLTHTKGSKEGVVLISRDLLDRIVHYIDIERAGAIAAARRRASDAGATFRDDGYLFVNGVTANNRDVGRKCSSENIGRIFRETVKALQLFRRERRYVTDEFGLPRKDEATGKYLLEWVLVPKYSFHDLRHTFAVTLYHVRVFMKDKNPIKTVQIMLRHVLSETTEKIYLRWLKVNEARISDSLSKALRIVSSCYA